MDVVVVDRGPIAGGMTSRTTAHLTAQCDDGFQQMLARRGDALTTTWFESQRSAIDRIEAIQRDLEIACNFRRLIGYLFKAPSTSLDEFEKEFTATRQVGMPVVQQKGMPLAGQEETPVIVYPNQATFHPLKYLAGLAEAIVKAGGRFYAQTSVAEIKEDGESVVATTAGGKHIRAASAVVATNAPINDRYVIQCQAGALSNLCDGSRSQARAFRTVSTGIPSIPTIMSGVSSERINSIPKIRVTACDGLDLWRGPNPLSPRRPSGRGLLYPGWKGEAAQRHFRTGKGSGGCAPGERRLLRRGMPCRPTVRMATAGCDRLHNLQLPSQA